MAPTSPAPTALPAPLVPFPVAKLLRPVLQAARHLLGALLVHRDADGRVAAGCIVEVEAYGQTDPASHSARGPTPRNQSMFGPPGLAYVYRSYGIHWCLNIVVGPQGRGEAVLVRALRATGGLAHMQARRGATARSDEALCQGPGNVCRAMGIDRQQDGLSLLDPNSPLRLWQGRRVPAGGIAAAPRIGIARAQERLWRLYLRGEGAVSRPRLAG